jgi:uncharacterized protein
MDALDLAAVPFVDAHMHPPLRQAPSDMPAYRWPWYEGSPDDTALAGDLVAYRWAVRALARHLGCAPDDETVRRAVAERDRGEWIREVVRAGNVDALVVDTGYPDPATALTWREIEKIAGVGVAPLLRLEHRAGEMAGEAASFDEFVDRYDTEVAGARPAGFRGLKSVIAYRSGLAVDPAASAADARAAFERDRARADADGSIRLTEKPLLDFLLVRALGVARRDGLPLQLHAGYGDRDLDLAGGRPGLLRPLLDSGAADGVAVVLLHGCFPFTDEAAVVTSIYANVYLDVATCVPPFGWSVQVDIWRTVLSVAPLSRVHASTDAAGLPEQIALGAWRARQTLAVALGELRDADALTAEECERVAVDVLGATARELYFGPAR